MTTRKKRAPSPKKAPVDSSVHSGEPAPEQSSSDDAAVQADPRDQHDCLTVLLAPEGVHVSKFWESLDPPKDRPYPKIYRWYVHVVAVADLDDLAARIERLSQSGRACVIRGEPLREYGGGAVVRRIHDDPTKGEKATFRAAEGGKHWLCVDVDGVDSAVDARKDPLAYAEAARQALPPELAAGRCWWQLSSSAAVKAGLRVHLWFWLERQAHDNALHWWARDLPAVDASIYTSVQPHYIAAPQFADGLADPVPVRTGWLEGTPTVWPAGLLDVAQWAARATREQRACDQHRLAVQQARDRDSRLGLDPALAGRAEASRVLTAAVAAIVRAPLGARNSTICAKSNHLGRLCERGVLSRAAAQAALESAAQAALADDWPGRANTTRASIAACLESGAAAERQS